MKQIFVRYCMSVKYVCKLVEKMDALVKKQFLFFLLIFGLVAVGNSQNRYNDYGKLQKRDVFKEDFNAASTSCWLGTDQYRSAKLANGYYCMEARSAKPSKFDLMMSEAPLANYEFELRLSTTSANGSAFHQVTLGELATEYLVFAFNSQGDFRVAWKGDRLNKTLCKQNTSSIYASASNKLTIKKMDKSVYFFMNESLIYTTASDTLGAMQMGFELATSSQAKIDYIRLSSLDDDAIDGPPMVVWEHPDKNPTVSKSASYGIRAVVYSSKELKEVSVYLNNELIEQKITQDLVFRSFKGYTYTIDRLIDLKEGSNVISIVAKNASGTTKAADMDITYGNDPSITDKRLALIIGNSNYKNGPKLKNAANDARLMAQTLENLGFVVIKKINASKSEIEKAMKDFGSEMSGYDVGLFYFAGHGIQTDEGNFVLPTDAKLDTKDDLQDEAIGLESILNEFGHNKDKAGIVILDACRDNPFVFKDQTKTYTGFRSPTTPSGTIVAFSTSEGTASSDGSGQNGLFTEELAKQIMLKQSIEEVFKETRKQVELRSSGSQTPQEWSKLVRDFYFRR